MGRESMPPPAADRTADAPALQYLTFTLGNEEYAVDILKVQEIRGYDAVTRIANTPEFIKGVINLRGVIVPIVDLRIKFGVGQATYNDFTVVIILSLARRIVGMVVDGVSDVVTLQSAEIRPAPEMGSVLDTRYIVGLAPIDERMIIVADIEKLMTSREMELVEPESHGAPRG